MTVLRAVGIESESHLAFAALHQLLRPVLDHAERLPAPQADALRTAFGLTSGDRDRFLVSLAVLTLLADVAEDRPLLCVVGDAQWLDRESADALLFTARRLEAEGIVLLFAARDARQERFVGSSLPELHLTGLSGDVASAVLHARVPAGLASAVADRLVALTGGNPLGLHELPGILTGNQLAGRAPLPDPLPVSGGIERAFLAQVRRLPASSRAVLVIAAAEDVGDTSAVQRAADALGYPVDALEAAESAGLLRLLRLRDAGLEFRHPLVRSAVYRSATATQRRAAHGALAAALHPDDDADRRAWHRAAATVGSDAAAADDLERSAGRAGARGGQAAAAAAFERAAEISPDDASRLRRLVAAADAASSAGLADRASGLLDRASTQTGDPRTAADISRLRGVIERHTGTMSRAYTILRDGAAAVASVDPKRSASMLVEAGVAAWDTNQQDWMDAAYDALDALDMPSDSAAFGTHFVNGLARLHSGDVEGALPPLLQVLSIARRGDQPRELTLAAAIAMFLGDDKAGVALYARAVAEARTRGEGGVLATLLAPAAALEAWTGKYQSAVANATEAIGLAAETRQPTYGAMAHAALAWVHAVQGREHDARSHAEAALSAALRHEMAAAAAIATWAIAHVELCAGRVDRAHALFESLREVDGPRAHPQVALFAVGDIVEAAVRVGAQTARGPQSTSSTGGRTTPRRVVLADAPWRRGGHPRPRFWPRRRNTSATHARRRGRSLLTTRTKGLGQRRLDDRC